MKPVKLSSEEELIGYLRRLREQDEAAPAPAPAQPAQVEPAPAAQRSTPTPETKVITVEDVIDKLNIVRSGKSTKDADVKRELEEYVSQFTDEEKTALIAFLEGMGQILTSGIDSTVANEPGDPYALQVQKIPGVEPKKNISASPATPEPAKPQPAPVPIKVGG